MSRNVRKIGILSITVHILTFRVHTRNLDLRQTFHRERKEPKLDEFLLSLIFPCRDVRDFFGWCGWGGGVTYLMKEDKN